jgi:4-hydroxy-tetrahydrodipicolinate synthase
MYAALERGDLQDAIGIHAQLIESFEFVNSDSSVFSMSIKAMLRELGHDVGKCRLPLPPAPDDVRLRAREVIRSLAI